MRRMQLLGLQVWEHHLGIKLSTGELYRIPREFIPEGFVKVNKLSWYYYKGAQLKIYEIPRLSLISVYNENGNLKPQYWSLKRWIDEN